MKKLLMLCIGLLSVSLIAQDTTDALNYSLDNMQGTARFRAMSGAFGALGGDLSSIQINPAGSAIFNNGFAAASLGFFNNNTDVRYNTNSANTINSFRNTEADLNQAGATVVFVNSNPNSPWKKFALSGAYENTGNFNNEWISSGISTTSIDNYFQHFTNNIEIPFGILKLQPDEFIEEAYADIGSIPGNGYGIQQAFLGYWAGIIDPINLDDETNDLETDYISNIAEGEFNQSYVFSERGYNGKLAFNFAAEYDDKLSVGINLNAHFIDRERYTRLNESNTNDGSIVTNLAFENLLTTTGSGFSFQLGAILKVTPELRAGFSYQSPTWYRINEELVQGINSNNADPEINFISSVINIFPEYRLSTPGSMTGSLAYVFGKKGLISFDYMVKDYSNTRFRPTNDPSFTTLNNQIDDVFTTSNSYRLGGEYRYKQFSFRGGYRFEESPYEDDRFFGDLTGYSAGLGYNFGQYNIDIAFSQSERQIEQQLYNVGLTNRAAIDSKFTDIILTFGIKL